MMTGFVFASFIFNRHLRIGLICMALSTLLGHSALGVEPTAPRPFKKVLVMTGGGFQTAAFLGMLDAFPEGQKPDLIIGTCGGGVAAALATTVPDSQERLDFLLSDTFHRELLRIELCEECVVGTYLIKTVTSLSLQARDRFPAFPIPKIRGESILRVPDEFALPISKSPFPNEGSRALIIGSQFKYSEKDEGKGMLGGSHKLFNEVYFTDPVTATHLTGLTSPISRQYPSSAVDSPVIVESKWNIGQAARAGISNIRYIDPILVEGNYYGGGIVNLYPIELALHLGEEVWMTLPQPFGENELLGAKTSLGYDINNRVSYVQKKAQEAGTRVRWILTKMEDAERDALAFDPKVDKGVPWSKWVELNIPKEGKSYRSRVQQQYAWGKGRALAAIRSAN